MRVVTTERELAAIPTGTTVLVPTMGALHDGHISLVRQAVSVARNRQCDGVSTDPVLVVVSIFVNPTQFGQPDDLARYPRTLEADVAACEAAGADLVFAPDVADIYPPGRSIRTPDLPPAATQPALEDALRPGHFAGVCQVVLRLFEIVRPSHAVFGEKDWQQLQVVRAMTAYEGLPIQIVPGQTVRDPDGLAMSSRNRFLSPSQRASGLALIGALRAAQSQPTVADAERIMHDRLRTAGLVADYAVVRDAETLAPLAESPGRPKRAIIAAKVGGASGQAGVRLLDNLPWPNGGSV